MERDFTPSRYTRMARKLAAAAAATAVAILAAAATARAGSCSSDTFTLEHTALTVTVCTLAPRRTGAAGPRVKPAPPTAGTVEETVSARGHAPLTRSASYSRLPSEVTARTIDDVPLQALGVQKTLHLTLAISGGVPRVEHALVIPGAIVLK